MQYLAMLTQKTMTSVYQSMLAVGTNRSGTENYIWKKQPVYDLSDDNNVLSSWGNSIFRDCIQFKI